MSGAVVINNGRFIKPAFCQLRTLSKKSNIKLFFSAGNLNVPVENQKVADPNVQGRPGRQLQQYYYFF